MNDVHGILIRTLPRVLPVLRVASEIVGKIPTRRDSWAERVAKALAMLNTVNQVYGGGSSKIRDIIRRHALVEVNSPTFVRLFFSSPIRNGFTLTRTALDEHSDILEARMGAERLFFRETRQGGSRTDSTFYHTPGLRLASVVDQLWREYEHGIYVSVGQDPYGTRETTVCEVPLPPMRYFSSSAAARLGVHVATHQKFAEAGIHRTYLLIGERGVGKTTFAVMLSKAFGGRLLALDAAALPSMGIHEVAFLVELLAPRFLLIDDMDQAPVEGVRARMRFLFPLLKTRFPGTTVLFAVNDPLLLDAALCRPGRIDVPIDFAPPSEEERREMILGMLADSGQDPTPELVAEVGEATKGMGHAYLADLCRRLGREPRADVIRSVTRLFEIGEAAKNAAAPRGGRAGEYLDAVPQAIGALGQPPQPLSVWGGGGSP